MSSGMLLEHDWFTEPLPENVVIGSNSWLYSSYSFLHFRSQRRVAVKIGRSCGIYNGCFFELGPQGQIEVGDFTALVGVIFSTNGTVSIGDYCFMAHEVVIADGPVAAPPGFGPPDKRERNRAAHVWIGNHVWIGAGETVLDGAKIGDGAIIGAGAVIDFEVPSMTVVAGNPARILGNVPG